MGVKTLSRTRGQWPAAEQKLERVSTMPIKIALFVIALSGFLLSSGSMVEGATNSSGPMFRALRGDGGTSAFYAYDGELPVKPGELLRQEPLETHQFVSGAAQNIRLLYSSTDGIDGRTIIPVSGSIFFPGGTPPKGGWPLLLWSHGTVGIADVCAPTWTGYRPVHQKYLRQWLAQGYAIVASDYQGLGTAGTHPYLATRPASYSNLDVIRAVQNSGFPLSDKVVLIGQSQGAAAAFATAGYYPEYAPELNILGVVATGIPYFTPAALEYLRKTRPVDKVDPMLGYNFTAMTLIEQLEPDFQYADYISPAAMQTYQDIENTCYQQIKGIIVERELTYRKSFKSSPDEVLPIAYAEMTYPQLELSVPAFIGSGELDRDTPLRMQAGLIKTACAAGSVIQAHVYPGQDHVSVLEASTGDSVPFVRAAFAGEPIRGNCADLSAQAVPKPGEVFSYKDITPQIWDATKQNKQQDPMNDLVETMRANRAIALNDPKAPRQFAGEDLLPVEFSSSTTPWQTLEEVFPLDWAAIEAESPQELQQLRQTLRVKTVLNHPDIKIIELSLGAGGLLPRHSDAAPGAFHILEGSAEITVAGETIRAYTGTSVKLESLTERRIKVTSGVPLKMLWFRWAPGGEQEYLDYGYYLTGSNFHAQPLESVMPPDYEHWEGSVRKAYIELTTPTLKLTQKGFYAGQQLQLVAAKKSKRFASISNLYSTAPLFSNELDVGWLDFENIPAEGFFWAKDASKAGHALKAWNKMVRMKGVFQAKVPGSQYDFNISYIAVGPKGKYITHSHATPEFYYILGGETEWIVEGQRYVATAGNMYVHSPYMNHEMRGLIEGVPEVVVTGSWSPFGDRSVFQASGYLTESLPQQPKDSVIADDFDFHDFKLRKKLKFQGR